MKESLKTLISNLGGLTVVAAAELVPKMLKHRAGLGKDINTFRIGGKTNAKSSL